MTVLTAAAPVMSGVFDLLQDQTLQAAIGGRLFDELPENVPRPCVLIEVLSETDIRGLGQGDLPEVDLRVHVFSDLGSIVEAQELNRQVKAILKDAAITIAGYAQAGLIVYHQTIALPNQTLQGVLVHEIVSLFTVWAVA
jgi:hypothetical protein